MRSTLKEIRPSQDRNILILGESGVGKSTWINGLANYVHYETLEEALDTRSKLYISIPTRFHHEDDKGERVKVDVRTQGVDDEDSDSNENFEEGKASTQKSTVYKLVLKGGELTYNLIDTPGLCDPDGIHKDEANMKNILGLLNSFEDVHAICILMRPNVTRLSTQFCYCLGEILTHLHKSACSNIMFCFTHTRATFYKATDTIQSLRAFFGEHEKEELSSLVVSNDRIFCFDNETFRLLALYKEGIEFDDKAVSEFSSSWSRSSAETARLLESVDTLRPHRIEETMSLNEAKELIFNMSRTLVIVCEAIDVTCQRYDHAVEWALKMENEAADWATRLTIRRAVPVVYTLDMPYTACTHRKCVEVKAAYDSQTGAKETTTV